MKIRTAFALAALAAALITGPTVVRAFHDGGVGACDGCHSIHSYENGVMTRMAGSFLLKGSDSSSTCLNCHEQRNDPGPTSYHVSTPDVEMFFPNPPKQLSPGGDFGWLKKSYNWLNAPAQPAASPGERHGHNIVAYDYGYMQDARNVVAPGGTYPSASLTCTSCHDPHGTYRRSLGGLITRGGQPIMDSASYSTSPDPDIKHAVGVYRLLGGNGYYPRALNAGYAFLANPQVAVAAPAYNSSETNAVTRIGYGAGMTEWCRNCHANIHKGTDAITHPSPSALGTTITAYYNSYVKTGDLTGIEDTAYWSLVPFEIGTDNYTTLKMIVTNTPTRGPDPVDGNPAVMCLSCHRAHASGWDAGTRWNTKTQDIVFNGNYSQEGQIYQPYGQGRTEAEALQAYYQTPAARFNALEQSFCFKCHSKLPP